MAHMPEPFPGFDAATAEAAEFFLKPHPPKTIIPCIATPLTELDAMWDTVPLSGWTDNVTCNRELTRKIRDYAASGRVYRGRLPGMHHDGAVTPTNRHLQLYLAKLRSNDARTKLKADERFLRQEPNRNVDRAAGQNGAAPEDDDDELDTEQAVAEEADNGEDGDFQAPFDDEVVDDDNLGRRRTRATQTNRALSQQEVDELQSTLFSTKAMVLEGIANARANHGTTARGLGADIRIPNIEYGGWRLKPYQLEAIGRWECEVRDRRGAILADEMGLGKTWVTIGVIQRLVDYANEHGRSILVGLVLPRNLVGAWTDSLAYSSIRVGDYSHADVKAMSAVQIKDAFDVIIIPTGSLVSAYSTMHTRYLHKLAIQEGFDQEVIELTGKPLNPTAWIDETLFSLDLDQLIIDEAHSIKNPTTKLAMAMRSIPARARVALTGTPMQNNLNEFGALLMFIRNKPFGNPGLFRAVFTSKVVDGKKLTTERDQAEEQTE